MTDLTPRGPAAASVRRQRDRRGRGMRGPLLPPTVPAFRTRAQRFDATVVDVVGELEGRWGDQLRSIEFAVDEVPTLNADGSAGDNDVVDDYGIPLCRFLPPGVDRRGRPTKARIIVYRRPIELRTPHRSLLAEIVEEIVAEQLTAVLGEPPAQPPAGA